MFFSKHEKKQSSGIAEGASFEDYSSGLSRADRRAIVSGAFWVCLITMGLTCVLMGFVYSIVAERDREATAEFLNRVSAYLGSATEQEYSQFAQTLRHDLVVSLQTIETFLLQLSTQILHQILF